MFKKLATTITAIAVLLSATSANALSINRFEAEPTIYDYSAQSYDLNSSTEELVIDYCIEADAYVTVGVYEATSSTTSLTLEEFVSDEYQYAGCHQAKWDIVLKSGPDFFYGITTENGEGSDYVAEWINYEEGYAHNTDLEILDLETKNSSFDPEKYEEFAINFTLTDGAKVNFTIYDKKYNKVKTVVKNSYFRGGSHTITWDGTDLYDDSVTLGTYRYELTAENDTDEVGEEGTIKVTKADNIDQSTLDPRLKYSFLTKETFDPGSKEETHAVFTLTAEANVTVEVVDYYDEVITTILDKKLAPDTYSVSWDGYEAIDSEDLYYIHIKAQNKHGKSSVEHKVYVEEEDVDHKKPNVYKDELGRIIFDPSNGDYQKINFILERDAEVTVKILENGNTIATLADEEKMADGYRTVVWYGKDKYGQTVSSGLYQYEITAENNKGVEIEEGYFSVEKDSKTEKYNTNCSSFSDVYESHRYCDAISWAYNNGIFKGYNDNSFKPNRSINRAEALKVILEAMDVGIIDAYGENLGFFDVDRFGWYTKYLKTAMTLGVVNGYNDGSFRPNNPVSRVEALKIIANTGQARYGYYIPSSAYGQAYYDTPNTQATKWYQDYVWFAQNNDLTDNSQYFYPDSAMTRAEMADMLYRFHQAGLAQ